MTSDDGYLLDNQETEAGLRFDALAELFDPVTFRHLDAVGIAPGWCCWEVGAGGPGVPTWLAGRVGPAGRVVASDIGEPQRLANRIRHNFRSLLAQRGADLSFERTLPRLLRDAGLADVAADAFFPVTSPACSALEIATVGQIRDRLTAGGLASDVEIDRHLGNVATGRLDLATAPMISAWARKSDTE